MTCNGKLINSYTPNTNHQSPIDGFEIITCRELPDYEGGTIIEQVKTAQEFLNTDQEAIDEPFYRVFAVYKKESNRARKAIGDFYNIQQAISFISDITGTETRIYSY